MNKKLLTLIATFLGAATICSALSAVKIRVYNNTEKTFEVTLRSAKGERIRAESVRKGQFDIVRAVGAGLGSIVIESFRPIVVPGRDKMHLSWVLVLDPPTISGKSVKWTLYKGAFLRKQEKALERKLIGSGELP